MKAIVQEDLNKIVARFFSDIEELNSIGGLIIEDINSLSIMFSIEHIIKYHLPINDSLHLYTALKYKNQLLAAEAVGLSIWNPESE